MDYLKIEYFIQVAKMESISKAADILRISQSSLSQTIRRLENELGTQLFDRKGRRIYLNENGKRFLTHASNSLDELNKAKSVASRNDDIEVKGHIEISIFAPISFIMDCLSAYAKKFRLVNFTINSVIGQGDLPSTQSSDFYISYDIAESQGYANRVVLAKSNRYWVLPESARAAKSLTIKEIALLDFVSVTPTQSETENGFQYLASSGSYPNIRFKTNDASIKRAILENGLAAGHTNEYINKELKQTGNFFIESNLREMSGVDVIMLHWPEGRTLGVAARSFLEHVRNWYNV